MAANQTSIPYMPEPRIERAAADVLAAWSREHGWTPAPPVPVEEVIESQLGLLVEHDDLRSRLGLDDVLGAIWFEDKLVVVEQQLDPEDHPHRLGRYRWTLSHEAGHWILHRGHFLRDPAQTALFGDRGAPAFICRSTRKPPVEIQADLFAKHLLLPAVLLREAWRAWRGDTEPAFISDLRRDASPAATDDKIVDRFVRPLADRFEASREATRNRVLELSLVLKSRDGLLFS